MKADLYTSAGPTLPAPGSSESMVRHMPFINISHPEENVSFPQAVVTGLGKGQGLFFPEHLTALTDVEGLLKMGFVSRSAYRRRYWLADVSGEFRS